MIFIPYAVADAEHAGALFVFSIGHILSNENDLMTILK